MNLRFLNTLPVIVHFNVCNDNSGLNNYIRHKKKQLNKCNFIFAVAPRLVCPDPGQIASANRLNTDGSPSQAIRPAGQPEYPVGHSLVYTCVPGYALEGRPLIKCLSSGKWSYRTPYCRRIPTPTTTTGKLTC